MSMVPHEPFERSFPIKAFKTSSNGIETEPKLTFKSQEAIKIIIRKTSNDLYECSLINGYFVKKVINFRIALPLCEISPFASMLISANEVV